MDELWFTLESLCTLLNFEHGWQTASAIADAWPGFYDGICGKTFPSFNADRLVMVLEPDAQRFSISTLTAVASMGGGDSRNFGPTVFVPGKLEEAAASIFKYSSSTSLMPESRRRR